MVERGRTPQLPTQTGAIEDVVAEHERACVTVDELLTEQERLRKAIGARLHLVLQRNAVLRAVAKLALDVRPISTEEYFAHAKAPVSPRPTYSTLDLAKIEGAGFETTDWRTSLHAYVAAAKQ